MSNASMVQVSRLANIVRNGDSKTAVFKNAIADALIELHNQTGDPRVKAERIISGTISSTVTVNAASLIGTVEGGSGLIVNASAIIGLIDASQIGSVNTTSFVGTITAGQIFSVNATSITGVVVSSQLADGIIDSLNKFSAPLRDTPTLAAAPSLPNAEYPNGTFYYNTTSSTFFENVAGTWTATTEGAALSGKLNYYFVGKINVANSFIGLITAAQIGSVNASTITGTITSGGPVTVQAGAISGTITSGGPVTIEVGSLTGTIVSGGPVAINGGVIQNLTIAGGKLEDATIGSTKIIDLNVSKLTAGTATFSSAAVFNQGTAQLELTAGAVVLKATNDIAVQLTAASTRLSNGSRYIDITASAISLVGDGTTAQLTSSALTFTATTANTVISAGGVQIYGGSTGIGIGNASFAASPVRISTAGIFIEFSSIRSLQVTSAGVGIEGPLGVVGDCLFQGNVDANVGYVRGFDEVGAYAAGTHVRLLVTGTGGPRVVISGNKVLGERASAIANPAANVTDLAAWAASIGTMLRTHGLMAT